MLHQSRPLDAIVVIDDASPVPPVDIVRSHEEVTLLGSDTNVGPYGLVQAVIDATDFDAYLLQDADDWSSSNRLEVLLETAAATGAELAGSDIIQVLVDGTVEGEWRFPRDVNAALRERPTRHVMMHPSTIVARALVQRLGGYATGMRFSGDTEFIRRAALATSVVNAQQLLYFRRRHPGSLTSDPEIGMGTKKRTEVRLEIDAVAKANAEASAKGDAPDLRPFKVAASARLKVLAGSEPVRPTQPRAG